MKTFDYLIIGSGCAGATAAQTLIDAGVNVAMLDVGITGDRYKSAVPSKDFVTIRKSETDQYRYLIGEDGEGIAWGSLSKGAQVTPPRSHIVEKIDNLIPLESDTFSPLESLGYGGLGIGWGLQCWTFSSPDLKKTGLNLSKMQNAYEAVSQRIGISASQDAAASHTIGALKNFQPSARIDRNHQYIAAKYQQRKARFLKDGLYVGRTPLALLTERLGDRQPYKYQDMDFYTNNGNSAWRPWVTIDRLRKNPKFSYFNDCLVTRFEEKGDVVNIHVLHPLTLKQSVFQSKKLIIASGALGTARLVLRSLGNASDKLPLLSNPHSYIPCIQPRMVGKTTESQKLSLGQLSYFIDKKGTDDGLSVASSYSYQSLMLFRVITQAPLNFSDARRIMQYLISGMVIMIAQHPDEVSAHKYLQLSPDASSPTGDKLLAQYALSEETEKIWNQRERQYVSAMRKFNTYALKRVHPPHGSAIHYAGTVPFSKRQRRLSLSPSGRVHGLKHVYVADSSGFNYLPAKGLTFSLMANAHITAENVLHEA